MAEGNSKVISDADPGAWAFALRAPPWIEDGNGVLFNRAFQLCKYPGRQLPDGTGFMAPLNPFHSLNSSAEEQDNHEPQS